jgi:filamentous hemagglutinin family protein
VHHLRQLLLPLAVALVGAVTSAAPAPAQLPSQGLVVRDGSLGDPGLPLEVPSGIDPTGAGVQYLITHEMGELVGGRNLFHSFDRFGIGSGETATFTGPDSVENVVSRVTGGDPSSIDGTLRSTMPNADVYLLNPAGLLFGPGGRLCVQGSFHASTGDYLGFGDGGLDRFYSDATHQSVLSMAPPTAFGFLGESQGRPISVADTTLATRGPGEALELFGGDVTLTGATLEAPGGVVSIRGSRIVVEEHSKVLAETRDGSPAGVITIEATEAIESVVVDRSLLSVSTHAAGDAGTIRVKAPQVVLRNGPGLVDIAQPATHPANRPHPIEVGASAETRDRGQAGLIEIEARSVRVVGGAGLSAQTVGGDGVEASGAGGTVRIAGADTVRVADRGFVTVESWGSRGNAGRIEILEVGELTVDGDDPQRGEPGPRFPLLRLPARALARTRANPGKRRLDPDHGWIREAEERRGHPERLLRLHAAGGRARPEPLHRGREPDRRGRRHARSRSGAPCRPQPAHPPRHRVPPEYHVVTPPWPAAREGTSSSTRCCCCSRTARSAQVPPSSGAAAVGSRSRRIWSWRRATASRCRSRRSLTRRRPAVPSSAARSRSTHPTWISRGP